MQVVRRRKPEALRYGYFSYLYEIMSAQKQEGNKYDKILKENFEVVLPPFLKRYFGLNIVEFEKLDTKLQTTIEKETDFIRTVTTAEGGTLYFAHRISS